MKNEIAILMAAGLGSRLRPITEKIPKPLVKVNNVPMIETVIGGLNNRGIGHIYVVVGYLKEQFEYLKTKYNNVSLITSHEYLTKNNISSIHAVGDIMGSADCFICEADLYLTDCSILEKKLEQSCYYGKMIKGYSDDWVFDVKDNHIVRIGKGGKDTYNMVGISYFKKEDAKVIHDAIEEAYKSAGHEQLFWDEIVNQLLDRLDLCINPIEEGQIVEIDTIDDLKKVDLCSTI